MRPCPICLTSSSATLHTYRTTYAGEQSILACNCGMVYASGSHAADYEASIYSAPSAIGSGASPFDRERLRATAQTLSSFLPAHASILDVGCAQGGLLDALRERGFTDISGIDPSPACADAARARGHRVHCGYLDSLDLHFDCIILSHVLEHIEDVRGFLSTVTEHLTLAGVVYIEVPDASRYAEYTLPLLDLNSEHINHFSLQTLFAAISADRKLFVKTSGTKSITLTNGSPYPALWALAAPKSPKWDMMRYLEAGTYSFYIANQALEAHLGEERNIALYGAGEYLCHVLSLPAIASRNVVQVVDRNPSLWGREIRGCLVAPPSALLPEISIVIAAVVAEKAIRSDIAGMGLTNPVYGLEFQ